MQLRRLFAHAALCASFIATWAQTSSAQEASTAAPPNAAGQPGDPIPPGYHVAQPKGGTALVVIGTVVFLGAYVPALGYGALGSFACAVLESRDGGGGSCDPPDPRLLLLPVVGPFTYVAGADSDDMGGTERALLLTDGVLQVGGAVALLSGIVLNADARPVLVRNAADNARLSVRLAPMMARTASGLWILGSF